MRRWFAALPIHRKLVVMALVVTTAALVLATVGLVVVDVWRYRATALDDTTTLAAVIAENTAAAVLFEEPSEARNILATVRVRSSVRRACLYLPDGTLFAGFARTEGLACERSVPADVGWMVVTGSARVSRNDRVIGIVYVERELSEIPARIGVATVAGLIMLVIAGGFAFVIAQRLNRTVSAPIAQLASAARAVRPDKTKQSVPEMYAGQDEIGDLVRAFNQMLLRVEEANSQLLESNEALRRQQAERETLLLRERQASRLKDEFLAAVSHELRTPLNAIMGWIQILTTTTATEQTTARAIASIARNAKAQTRVIEDLVDVSRIVTGKLSLRFDPVDLREPIESAVDVTRAAAQAKDVALKVELPGEPCLVNGDRDRLQQIVWNLLSNATKFTPSGGAVSVSLTRRDGAFVLDVTDTGIGISKDFLQHVFDRFRQADGSMTREHGGLGLGLSIVKELTELHGGSVAATSAGPDRGASFTIRLPSLAGLHVQADRSIDHGARLDGFRVLAVDDNVDALDVLSASLTASGADVRVASSGLEALREWDREPPDVLICDLAMPHMDGFEVLRRIRERDAVNARVTPAVALTAHASDDHQAKARAAGFDCHVAKPYGAAELSRVVSMCVKRKPSHEDA